MFCISEALTHNNICPIDRQSCTFDQLQKLDGLPLRIWSGIQVKCGAHDSGCVWRGSIADYYRHVEINCSVSRNPTTGNNNDSALTEELETLRHENLELKDQLEEKNEELRQLVHLTGLVTEQVVESAREEYEYEKALLRQQNHSLRQSRDSLRERLNERPNLRRIFRGSYDFRREDVVELSQLISMYLDDKPRNIDSNKIFNCVRTCYTALDKNYNDNPPDYYEDMRMMLATCLSSNWFTDNQWNNIDSWYEKHFNTGR